MKIFFWRKKKRNKRLPFKRTFENGEAHQRCAEALEQNYQKVEENIRGNYGGGCPCPFQ